MRVPYISVLFFILVVSIHVQSQNFDKLNIPITQNNRTLQLPYTGGLKAPQFSNIDFNGDGVLDLFVFDRNGDQILPFVKTGVKGSLDYRFAPEYISQFPTLRVWALLVDFNNDGVKDIFTASSGTPVSIEVWKGKANPDGRITYKRLKFDYGSFPFILQFQLQNSGYSNVYVSNIDLPAIADVDGDGDIDIVSFEADGSYASYYKNVSKEENLGADSLKYERVSICWGGFAENQFNEKITLSPTPFECAQGITNGGNGGSRHSGSTLTIFDSNGDNLMDLLIGDLSSSTLKKLINGGTKETALMTEVEENFPSNDVPVLLEYFLAAFYVDVDGDNIRDLVVAPNDINNAENSNHVWLYRNKGTDVSPVFKFEKKDFLIDEMAYFNGGSHPAFADVNGDGLLDLVIGTTGVLEKKGLRTNKMFLLTNTGDQNNPKFDMTDEDFLEFSQYKVETGRFAPTFGDLDSDGDLDLVVGDATGDIYYARNLSSANQPMQFSQPLPNAFDFMVGQNAKPQIYDLDGDQLKDIILGKKNNGINFYKNIGSPGNPIFKEDAEIFPNTSLLGNVFPLNEFATQNSAPFLFKSEGKLLLMVGTEDAGIKTYDNLENNMYKDYNLLYDKTGNINQGRKVVPALADIDKDGYYEMAIGNERGGIAFYNTIFKVETVSNSNDDFTRSDVEIYPNPANNELMVVSNNPTTDITLTDTQGRYIKNLVNKEVNSLDGIMPGLYYIKVTSATETRTKKLVIIK